MLNETTRSRNAPRAATVVISVVGLAGILQYIVTSSLLEPVTADSLIRCFVFASPIAVPAWRGHAGVDVGRYPSSWFVIVAFWTVGIAPSMVEGSSSIRDLFLYDTLSEDLGRAFVLTWNWVFALACPRSTELPRLPQFLLRRYLALVAFWLVTIAICAQAGQLAIYGGATEQETGGLVASAVAYKVTLTGLMPGMALHQYVAGPRRHRWLSYAVSGLAVLIMMVIGSRSLLMIAAASTLVVAGSLGLRIRLSRLAAVGLLIPVLMTVMFASREGLVNLSSASTADVITTIGESTSRMATESGHRETVLAQAGENIGLRFGYAPQIYATVAVVLSRGPAFRGTYLEGVVRMIPTVFYAEKNTVAYSLSLEPALWDTGHFPLVDLGPTPWLQWVFEFGFPAAVLGALFYAGLARVIQVLMESKTFYGLLFSLTIFNGIIGIEHQTDGLMQLLRDICVVAVVTKLVGWRVETSDSSTKVNLAQKTTS